MNETDIFKGKTEEQARKQILLQVREYCNKYHKKKQYETGDKISYAKDMYSVIENADVLAVLTEWDDFKKLDLDKAANLMKHKNIVDCRNMFSPIQAEISGFKYQGIGKKF